MLTGGSPLFGVGGGGGYYPGEQKQKSAATPPPPPFPPFIRPHRLHAEQRKRSPSDTPGRSSFLQSSMGCVLRPRQRHGPRTAWGGQMDGGTDGGTYGGTGGDGWRLPGEYQPSLICRDANWPEPGHRTLKGQQTGASVTPLCGRFYFLSATHLLNIYFIL